MGAALHRAAPVAGPNRDQVLDFLEGAAEPLGPGDEVQAGVIIVVVEPVAGGRAAGGGHEPTRPQKRSADVVNPVRSAASPIVDVVMSPRYGLNPG